MHFHQDQFYLLAYGTNKKVKRREKRDRSTRILHLSKLNKDANAYLVMIYRGPGFLAVV